MELSSGIYFENFSRQSGFVSEFIFPKNFNRNLIFNFGFSGNSIIQYKIYSGLIFDDQNRNIYSLNYEHDTNIKIETASGISICKADDILLSKSQFTGSVDNLFLSGNGDCSLGVKISGEVPNLTFYNLNDFSGLNNVITGKLINNTPERIYKISNIYITDNSNFVSGSGFTTGNISETGYVYLWADTGISYPTGNIGLIIETNFKNLNYNFNSNPTNQLISDEYLQLYPGSNLILSTLNDKEFDVVSYFNSGNSRNINVKLEYISGCTYAPIEVIYLLDGSGNISNTISGSGNLTGIVTGYFTGNSGYLESGYSQPYIFTGNYTGTHTTTGTGLHNGIQVTGQISSGYNVNLNSGNLGLINLGTGTGLITGNITVLSGLFSTGAFSMSASGADSGFPSLYITGYTGLLTNTYSGSRSFIETSGLYYALTVANVPLLEINDCIFDLARWEHSPTSTGNFITGFNVINYIQIDSGNYSGTGAGPTYIYTGRFAYDGNPQNYDIEDFVSENTSGYYRIYLGVNSTYSVPSTVWTVNNFSIQNFPIDEVQSINSTGTGVYIPIPITGFISSGVTGIDMYTGVTEYPGQKHFTGVWNFKTGFSRDIYTDFRYNNLISGTGTYLNSGSNFISEINKRNSFFVEVDHNGEALSGLNIAKLSLNDGILNEIYYITGQGEIL